VPFYARRFAEYGFRASSVTDVADLARLPPLEKAEVVAQPEAFLAQDRSRAMVTRKATGGSTGERMVFYRDAEAMARNFAHVLRNHTWTGLRLGRPHVLLWGAHFDLKAQQRVTNRLVNTALRQRYLDAFAMNAGSMADYHARLARWRPALLSSYVTAAVTLADHIVDRGLAPLGLPALATTAEMLFPAHRAKLQSLIARQVFDRFGCREIGNTAHECEAHDGLHVNAEHVVLEVVDGAGRPVADGETGDILYTSLGNQVFPLIRYRVGDRARTMAPGRCACGRGLPRIAGITGRITDMLIAADGTRVHGEYFSHLFYAMADVREFHVVQEARDAVVVLLRLARGTATLGATDAATLRGSFERVFGSGLRLDVRVVDTIPPTASGKHRFTECRIGTGEGRA
jgi:phenylacetate-CoA ligase